MNKRMKSWKYFGGAAILTLGLMFKFGAPLLPLILGLAFAALLTARLARKAA